MLTAGGAAGQAVGSGDPCSTNQPPRASFVAEGAGGGDTRLRSTSTDPEGRPLNSVRWYSDYPGFPDGIGGDEITFDFPPGRHEVTLVVRDDCDSMSTTRVFIDVGASGGDGQAPQLVVKSGQKTVPVRRGAFVFSLRPFSEHVLCRLGFRTKHRVQLPAARPSAAARSRRLRLGTKRLDLDPGERARVRVRLSRVARAVLARDRKLRMQAVIVATDDSGNRASRTFAFTLKRPRR